MLPTIQPGSIIIFDKTPDSIKIGDVIVYYHPDYGFIGHRVIMIVKTGYVVMGDNNPTADPWVVRPNQVVGKVVWVINDEFRKSVALFWLNILGYMPKGG